MCILKGKQLRSSFLIFHRPFQVCAVINLSVFHSVSFASNLGISHLFLRVCACVISTQSLAADDCHCHTDDWCSSGDRS